MASGYIRRPGGHSRPDFWFRNLLYDHGVKCKIPDSSELVARMGDNGRQPVPAGGAARLGMEAETARVV